MRGVITSRTGRELKAITPPTIMSSLVILDPYRGAFPPDGAKVGGPGRGTGRQQQTEHSGPGPQDGHDPGRHRLGPRLGQPAGDQVGGEQDQRHRQPAPSATRERGALEPASRPGTAAPSSRTPSDVVAEAAVR